MRPLPPDQAASLSPIDRALVIVLAAAAAVLAFTDLGAMRAPSRFWEPARAGETVVADLGGDMPIRRLSAYIGPGAGSYLVELSSDGNAWERPMRIEQSDSWGPMEWRAVSLEEGARWIRVIAEQPGLAIGELAVFDNRGSLLSPVSARKEPGEDASASIPAHPLFDEQFTAVFTPSRRTGTYFDEVYFARAGLAIAQGRSDPETSHPPLSKLLIAAAILILGPCPFAWRLFSALAGAAAVPILYLLARRLLGRTDLAFAAAFMFCLDFMRVVQSRIATPDTFVLLFTLTAFFALHKAVTSSLALPWLLAAGASLGAGAACKWSALFAAAGAGILFLAMLPRMRDRSRFVVPVGLLCLSAVPAAVYLSAYLPFMFGVMGFADVLKRQLDMWSYHAGVAPFHPFASPWWQWPLSIRPVWLYEGLADLAPGMVRSIASFGNPITWWPAAAAVLFIAAAGHRRRDMAAVFIVAAFASLYFPWAAAPRKLTFIYHYLPCVPFALLALARAGGLLIERYPRARRFSLAYLGLVAVSFAGFLPVLWGIAVPLGYARILRWLPAWTVFR